MALLNIFKGFFFLCFYFSPSLASSPYLACSVEGDLPPVNLQAEWRKEEHCTDLEGNIYNVGETLSSCWECLLYTCITEERDKCTYYKWKESTNENHTCCVDCHGMVFPPGQLINTTKLEDACLSVQTERCEANSMGGVFINKMVEPTICCVNSTGLQPLNSTFLLPGICSSQTCQKTTRHPQSFWAVKKEYPGCDCCLYKGTLVPDGWTRPLNNWQNLTCCLGELLETAPPVLPCAPCTPESVHGSVGFSIDNSGSISHSTVGVMSLANGIIDKIVEKNYTIPRWVLTTFKDNSADLLDHEDNTDLRIITKYVNKFNSSLNNISFNGGEDGPERATQGILLTLENLPMYGLALVFTDHQTKDVGLLNEIIALRNKKKIKIFIALAPSYSGSIGDDSWVAYDKISEGRIFNMADFNKSTFVSEVVVVIGENCDDNNHCKNQELGGGRTSTTPTTSGSDGPGPTTTFQTSTTLTVSSTTTLDKISTTPPTATTTSTTNTPDQTLTTPTTYNTTTTTPDRPSKTPGPVWRKVYSLNTAGGLFANLEETKKKNIDDPEADLFSILYDLESMRNAEGVFHFKLCYPEVLAELSEDSPCNEWTQSSNPLKQQTITGYAGITVTWNTNGIGGPFQGLGLSPPSFHVNLIDAAPDHPNRWYSIGSLKHYRLDTVPGPYTIPEVPVKKVELSVLYTPRG